MQKTLIIVLQFRTSKMIHRIQVEDGMFELQGKTRKTNLKSHSRNKRQNLSKVLNIHECVYIYFLNYNISGVFSYPEVQYMWPMLMRITIES